MNTYLFKVKHQTTHLKQIEAESEEQALEIVSKLNFLEESYDNELESVNKSCELIKKDE